MTNSTLTDLDVVRSQASALLGAAQRADGMGAAYHLFQEVLALFRHAGDGADLDDCPDALDTLLAHMTVHLSYDADDSSPRRLWFQHPAGSTVAFADQQSAAAYLLGVLDYDQNGGQGDVAIVGQGDHWSVFHDGLCRYTDRQLENAESFRAGIYAQV